MSKISNFRSNQANFLAILTLGLLLTLGRKVRNGTRFERNIPTKFLILEIFPALLVKRMLFPPYPFYLSIMNKSITC